MTTCCQGNGEIWTPSPKNKNKKELTPQQLLPDAGASSTEQEMRDHSHSHPTGRWPMSSDTEALSWTPAPYLTVGSLRHILGRWRFCFCSTYSPSSARLVTAGEQRKQGRAGVTQG